MIWWTEQPGRARQEQNAIGDLSKRCPWLANVEMRLGENLRLVFDFDLQIGDRTIPLSLIYPDLFPDTAPSIFARDCELLSSHQYGPNGELCLEHRPDNWTETITGAMMIESAHRLLSSEQETGQPAPSEHRITRAQRLRNSTFRFLYSADTLAALGLINQGRFATANVCEQATAGTYVAQLSRIGVEDAPVWKGQVRGGNEIASLKAIVVRLSEGKNQPFRDFDELRLRLWSDGFSTLAAELANASDPTVLILFDGARIQVALVFFNDGEWRIIPYDPVFIESERVRLDPEYERLKTAKVAIIGCGSVGSKVAIQLVRSGLANFTLVDGDILASGNLVRNELDWRSVGVHKAPAVKSRLKEINPDVVTSVWTNPLGGQESGAMASATLAAIEECDLIIDATAEPKVFNLCAAVARRTEKPLCWAQVFGGGTGGIVARARPNVDPTPLNARQRIEAWYGAQGVNWPDDGPSQPYAETGETGTPLIADDADVSVIASHLSRFVIDLLARPEATIFPYQAYAIGLRDRWLFSAPFDVHPIDLGEGEAWGAKKEVGSTETLKRLLADLIPSETDAG